MKISTLPSWYRLGMHLNYKDAPNISNNGKIIAITPLLGDMSWEETRQKGFTHAYSQSGIPISDKYEIYLHSQSSEVLTTPSNTYAAGQSIASQFDEYSVVLTQLLERGGMAFENREALMPYFYKGFADELGVSFLHNAFGDYTREGHYMGGQKFVIDNGNTSTPLHSYFVNSLQSQSNARMMINSNNQQTSLFYFFSNSSGLRMSDFMNILVDGFKGLEIGDDFAYSALFTFYDWQRKVAAGTDAIVSYAPWAETPDGWTENPHSNSGWRIPRDDVQQGAFWSTEMHHIQPIDTTIWLAIIGIFFAKGISSFDTSRKGYSQNPANLQAPNPLFPSTWNSNPSISAPAYSTTGDPYPEFPQSTQDLFRVVAGWFDECKPILNAGGQYQYFDYTSSVNGACNVNTTNTPDKRIFTPSVKPWGQDNILHVAHNRTGLMIGAKAGQDVFYIYFNGFLSPFQVETITPNIAGVSLPPVQVRGRTAAIYKY